MPDPVLDAHKILPRFYAISGGHSPISIRDQMIRGCLLVDRLTANGELNENSSLLVIGAGAGGVTAAIRAVVGPRIKTLLIEKSDTPFLIQKQAPSRYLNPNQYDWPIDHWPNQAFPWHANHMPMPLPYTSSTAGVLAANWEVEFRRVEHRFPALLELNVATQVINIDPDVTPQRLTVTFRGQRTGPMGFDTIIWAGGPGKEECRLFKQPKDMNPDPIYEGRAFWSRDPFDQPQCGLPNKAKVLITGTGDGGLQDYLRIVTGLPSPVDFYKQLNIPQEIAALIQSAEERAHRARVWVDEDRTRRSVQEKPLLSELHGIHKAAVESALGIGDVIDSLNILLPIAPIRTLLIGREPFFTNYYGLNRFLVLLVSRYIENKFGMRTVEPSTTIQNVTPVGHICMRFVGGLWEPNGGYCAPACHGMDHSVELSDVSGVTRTEEFNIIIVRYGFQENGRPIPPLSAPYQNSLLFSRPRHLLPYYLFQ